MMKLIITLINKMKKISISPVIYCVVCFLILGLLVKGVRSENTLQQINASRTPKPTQRVYSSTRYTVQATQTRDVVSQDIVRVSDNGDLKTGLVSHSSAYEQFSEKGSDIARYGDYLLQVDMIHYPSEVVGEWGMNQQDFYSKDSIGKTRGVNVFNTKTKEKFTVPFETLVDIDNMQFAGGSIVDDMYYFGFGNDFGIRLEYKIQLPPTQSSKIVKLNHSIGRWLHKIGNYYYTASCYEGCLYSLFDPQTQKGSGLDRLNATNSLSPHREYFEGFDINGNYILKIGKTADEKFETESVVLIDPTTEKEITTLLSADSFPSKEINYFSLPNSQTAIVTSSDLYIYNLNTHILTRAEADDETRQTLLHETNLGFEQILDSPSGTYCMWKYRTQKRYAFVLSGNKVTLTAPEVACDGTHSTPTTFADLNLGEEYKIVESKHPYPVVVTQKNTPEDDIPEGFKIIE